MTTWSKDTAPTWHTTAEADQLGWANEKTGEILVTTQPNTVNTNFLNQEERAKALAWVRAGLLIPSEAGMTGAIASITMISGGIDFTAPPVVTIVGDGTLGTAVATLDTVGTIKAVALTLAGTGYLVGDELLLEDTGTGCRIVVDTVDTGGEILTFTQVNKGINYTADGVSIVPTPILTATAGTGATFGLTVGFAVASIAVAVPGTEYVPHDTTITFDVDGTGAAAKVVILDVGSGDFATMESLAISRLP